MKKSIGRLGIILSLLFLSAEIYLLKIVQVLEHISGTWRTSAWGYLSESPCLIAVIVTVVTFIYSCYIACSSEDRD